MPPQKIVSTVAVPPMPGGSGPSYEKSANATSEYVAGGGRTSWYLNILRSLPWAVDDVSTDFGDDIYDRLLKYPYINTAFSVLKSGMFESGLRLSPAVTSKSDKDYDLARTITVAAERMFERLDVPIDDVMWDMADALAFGNRIAEQVYELQAGKLNLVRLAVKPRHSVAFAVDIYTRVQGVLGLVPGVVLPVQSGTLLLDPKAVKNFLPRNKFAVWTNAPVNGDPRGTSNARPAFAPWQRALAIWIEYMKYLTQFAGPSLIGYTEPNAQTGADLGVDVDSDGNPLNPVKTTTPEEKMLAALLAFRNGTAVVLPNGAKVDPLMVPGNGEAFITAIATCNSEMTLAVLNQKLTTQEAEHSSRAQAEVHQDTGEQLIAVKKRTPARMLRGDVLYWWVFYNWGQQAANDLCPRPSYGGGAQHDFGTRAPAIAQLKAANWFHPSQYAGIDADLELPPRDLTMSQADMNAVQGLPPDYDPSAPPTAPTPGGAPPANGGVNKPLHVKPSTPAPALSGGMK